MAKKILYIFLDESGDLNFSPTGSKYFCLTALSKERPFNAFVDLNQLKYDLIELGTEIEYFHASEDRQAVRNNVFGIINQTLDLTRIDSLIVEKRKTAPAVQDELHFYPQMLGYLLPYVIGGYHIEKYEKIIIFTDSIPLNSKKKAIEKAIKLKLAAKLPKGVSYQIYHHASKSNYDLQIVDYCNWAIFRKWEISDTRSYDSIKRVIKSEFNIFESGKTFFY